MTIEYPSQSWKDYELIDSGRGAKLERFGDFIMARPEPKALWDKSMTDLEWNRLCHTRFTPGAGFGKAGKEDSGIWERLRKMPDQWWISYSGGPSFRLRLGLTSFKHVGVFPEHEFVSIALGHGRYAHFDFLPYCNAAQGLKRKADSGVRGHIM